MRNPSIFASGFATVDVILGEPLGITAGGTAVNVALAMADLGWRSEFGGTVGNDPAGCYLHNYLADHGVENRNLATRPDWLTPVVVQETVRGDHVWRFGCPVCGTRFAKHRPAAAAVAEEIGASIAAPDVYFFDRATLYGIRLAEIWGRQGTTVVFEPAGLGRPQLFQRAAAAAHLIKYSSERGPAFASNLDRSEALIVETLGAHGARFRLRGSPHFSDTLPSNRVDSVVDSAGAGDWTTAGLLDSLSAHSSLSDALVDATAVREAVAAGQRLGARACTWQGVREETVSGLPAEDIELFACPRIVHVQNESRLARAF